MMILSDEAVLALLKTKHGQEFVEGVRQALLKFDLISAMPADLKDPYEIAVETMGRRRAAEILKELLMPFLELRVEANVPEEKEVY